MDVNIQEIQSTVRAVDSNSLLTPRVLSTIVQAVMEAMREREEHDQRVRAEQRITAGVHAEMEGH